MNLPMKGLKPVSMPLVGFMGDSIGVEGEITLLITTSTPPKQNIVPITFLVVHLPSTYNAVLGRSGLNLLDAIISTKHLLICFSTKNGVGEMCGDQLLAK